MEEKFPTKPTKIKAIDPQTLIIYAPPKFGKSCIAAGLTTEFAPGKALIISNQKGGYDYLEATRVEWLTYQEFADGFEELEKLQKEEKRYDFIIIDNLSTLNAWSELVGTYNYMRTNRGKSFNLKDKKNPSSGRYSLGDPEFETVHDIGQGFGYKYSRNVMESWLNRFKNIACHVILIAHTKTNKDVQDNAVLLEKKSLDLTGQVVSIYCKNTTGLALFRRKGKEGYLSFKTKGDDLIAGIHVNHLQGKEILISEEQEDGTIKTFWENIFINYKK